MARLFYHVMQDNLGNLLFGVTGTMRLAGSGTLATIYGDEALTVILPNPMTNHPSFGSFKCYVAAGSYDFYMAKGGYTFETLTGLQGLGTMSLQNATAVAITGGDAAFTGQVSSAVRVEVFDSAGTNVVAFAGRKTVGPTRWNLYCDGTAQNFLAGPLSLGAPTPEANCALSVRYQHGTLSGVICKPGDSDAGSFQPLVFLNLAGAVVGSISSTGAATAYNTTSDVRLKKMVAMFEGALDLVHQLRPVRFRWRTDDSEGNGFLANEVQQVLDGVVTGEPDAMNEDGSINPQQIDHSKLVPLLTAALKELSGQVQTLTERVHELEQQLRI